MAFCWTRAATVEWLGGASLNVKGSNDSELTQQADR